MVYKQKNCIASDMWGADRDLYKPLSALNELNKYAPTENPLKIKCTRENS